MTNGPWQVFVLRIACPPGAAGLHALKATLKFLLRRCGLRVISIDEEPAAGGDLLPKETRQ